MTHRSRIGLYAAFAGLGGTAATISALIPSFDGRFGPAALGAVPGLFTGLLVGVLLSAPLLVRLRARTVTALGAGLQAICLVSLTLVPSVDAVILAAALSGVGFGLTEAAGSVAAKRLSQGSATRSLTALTGTVAVAAAVSPILVAFTPGGTSIVPVLVAVLHVIAVLTLLCSAEPPPIRRSHDKSTVHAAGANTSRATLVTFALAAVGLALYVGAETVFSGWSAVIPAAMLDLDAQTAAVGTSVFWVCMATGRFLISALLRHECRPEVLLVWCTAITALSLAITTVLAHSPLSLITLVTAVIAMAPVYSLILGQALDRLTPGAAARATGPLVAAGAVGGSLTPTVILASGLQPASAGTFLVTAAICLVIGAGAAALLSSARASRTPLPYSVSPNVISDRAQEPTTIQQESSTP